MKGGMIALLPAYTDPLVIDGGEPADQLHLTLQYLGDDLAHWGATRRQQVIDLVEELVSIVGGELHLHAFAHATFNPDDAEESCAVYLCGGNTEIAPLQDAITEGCTALLGGEHPAQHEPWIPHITAGYGMTAADLEYTGPVVFDRLVVAIADDWTEIPLSSTLAALAREAYAMGWARSGGPLTERVALGAQAAVELACEHAEHPAIMETTLRLGSLEGTWAAIYDRRAVLYAQHITAVSTAYRSLVKGLDVDAAIRRFLAALPTTEAATADDPAARQRKGEIGTAASAEATRLLHLVTDDTSTLEFQATQQAISNALLDANAEGVASGVALVAQSGGAVGVDFDLVFADAHAALANLDDHWGQSAGWLGRVINGNAADLGQALARVAGEGGDYDALRAAAWDVLDGEDIRAVDTLIDLAMGQSFSRGALALYAREGLSTVEFITAGGGQVCPLCMDAESGNPWALWEVPQPALHPYCRCSLMPTDDSVKSLGANISRYLLADAG